MSENKKLEFAGHQIDVGVINLFDGDWRELKPRIKFQYIEDSPLSQIVFEAIHPQNPRSSKTFSHMKYLNGAGIEVAAQALLTVKRSSPRTWRGIMIDLFEKLEAADEAFEAFDKIES